MKLLCASSDLGELEGLVKRLVRFGIPCGVCKDSSNSQLNVWIQQDSDFPLALKIFVSRDKPRPRPPWADLLEVAGPAPKEPASPVAEGRAVPAAAGVGQPSVKLVQTRGLTRTGTA